MPICLFCQKESRTKFCDGWCRDKWVRENQPEKWKAWTKKHTISRRKLAVGKMDILREEKGNRCEKCGYDKEPRILEFHHLGNKKYSMSDASRNNTIEILREEIKKCILVCPNCHKIIHLRKKVAK